MSNSLTFKTKTLNLFRKTFTYSPFEKVLLSLVRGKDHQSLWSKFIPNPILYKENSKRRVERNNINYELDLSCLMQWYVYWDLHETQRDNLYGLVSKDNIVFDVGTNVGETFLNFAKLTGEEGFVYGFEPDEKNYKNVQKNISLNDFANIHVFNLGVSDKKETLKLYQVDEHNLGMNRVLQEGEASEDLDFTVMQTTTLDDIVKENNIPTIDLIKIDIEGYEMHALRGAKKILEEFKPPLFIEVGYTRLIKNGTSPNEMFKFLEGFGYTIYHGETLEKLSSDADYSYFGDGGIDVLAKCEK